ncbi:MAG TPA: phosphoribosyltransferase family protein [Vicinamibacteria bacterium]|nr:phosphoribosyltransferase family protein [Vicinamibacteria bacterium]
MFRDREEAGRRLAQRVAESVSERGAAVLVLGIPRGGVLVAAPVAAALEAGLDVMVPRKLGAPGNPELAIGALAVAGDREFLVLDPRAAAWLEVSDAYLEAERARQRAEIVRRDRAYRGARPPLELGGRVVVLVDDGIATGMTIRAAVAAVRRAAPKEVVVAAPVAPLGSLREIEAAGCRALVLETPWPFGAVGRFYASFDSVEDREVMRVLAASRPS